MASNHAVVLALGVLGRAFAGAVDEARIDVYAKALEDMPDEALGRAVEVVVKTHTGAFIPPPAVLRAAVAPAPPAVDVDMLVYRIGKLATYTPASGMIPPTHRTVQAALGEAVAYAYVAAGGSRLLSDDPTTASVARHAFDKAMREADTATALPVIGSGDLDPRAATLIRDTAKALPAASV